MKTAFQARGDKNMTKDSIYRNSLLTTAFLTLATLASACDPNCPAKEWCQNNQYWIQTGSADFGACDGNIYEDCSETGRTCVDGLGQPIEAGCFYTQYECAPGVSSFCDGNIRVSCAGPNHLVGFLEDCSEQGLVCAPQDDFNAICSAGCEGTGRQCNPTQTDAIGECVDGAWIVAQECRKGSVCNVTQVEGVFEPRCVYDPALCSAGESGTTLCNGNSLENWCENDPDTDITECAGGCSEISDTDSTNWIICDDPLTTPFTAIAAGKGFTCGLREYDHRAVCWGSDIHAPEGTVFSSIAAGASHVCAIREEDGRAECWGVNSEGQASPPTDISFLKLAAGLDHTCGIRADDQQIQCWGDNTYEQASPPSDMAFLDVTAGLFFSCGISFNNKSVECWGDNRYGQTVPPEMAKFSGISTYAEQGYICGIQVETQTLLCWGYIHDEDYEPPSDVAFSSITVGGYHACGVQQTANTATCWGEVAYYPNDVLENAEFEYLSAGLDHTCGIKTSDHRLECWGENSAGQLDVP